jgi:uncharacterized RDD family membrane protein YckC
VFVPPVLMKQKIAAFHFSLPLLPYPALFTFLVFSIRMILYTSFIINLMIQNQIFFLGKNQVTPGRLN